MPLEIISKDVMSLADLEIEKIKSDLDSQLSEFKDKLKTEFDSFSVKSENNFSKELSNLKERVFGHYQKEASKILLEAKSGVYAELKNQLLICLLEMPKTKREKFLKKLITVAKKEMDFSKVYCSMEDSKLIDSKYEIIVDEKIDGLKFESKDSKQILNCTYEFLIEDFLKENDSFIQEVLFK